MEVLPVNVAGTTRLSSKRSATLRRMVLISSSGKSTDRVSLSRLTELAAGSEPWTVTGAAAAAAGAGAGAGAGAVAVAAAAAAAGAATAGCSAGVGGGCARNRRVGGVGESAGRGGRVRRVYSYF